MLRNLAVCLLVITVIGCGSGGGVSSGNQGGGGGVGGGPVGGGADGPDVVTPPEHFPDPIFNGGGTTPSLVDINVSGVLSETGARGSTDFTVGVGPDSLSEVRANITNATSVQFVAQAGADSLAGAVLSGITTLVGFQDPVSGPQQTTAIFLDNSINSMPYPTSGLDAAIESGTNYRYQLVSSGAEGSTITGTVIAKNDVTPASGTLRVRMYLVGSIAQSSSNRAAIDDAIDVWRQIYSAAGITLDVTLQDVVSGTGIVPAPDIGSTFYGTNAVTAGSITLNMYIAAGISKTTDTSPGNTFGNELLGLSPSIPGPAVPTIKSAVALNIIPHAGPDGVFSNTEIEVFGSTMAHEAGHYLGLFHTVEFVGEDTNTYRPGDLFVDTLTCSMTQECIRTGAAGNLMFPGAIVGQNQQRDLSIQQRVVLNQQVIVD